MELEQPASEFKPAIDRRPHMPEPPPVWLIAVEDVVAECAKGLGAELDAFYVGLLHFEREHAETQIVYKAHNARLRLNAVDPPVHREDFRPIAIEVPSLSTLQQQLIEREHEFLWQRGLSVGQDQLLLRDPSGNWVAVSERRQVG